MTRLLPATLCIANALAYALNIIETSGFGPFSSSFSPDQDNASISQKYQTIITPCGIAFSIWAVIFIMQLVFVLVTLVSEERRNHPLVVGGVGFWYVLACIAQTLWSPAFAYEKLPLAAFVMSCILASLATIVYRQYNVVTTMLANQETVKNSDFWLLQFPFEIHLGWIVAAFVLNLNIVVVGTGASANTQVGVAAVSLASVTLLAVSCLVLVKRSLYTIAWVVVWATVRKGSMLICLWLSNTLLTSFASIRAGCITNCRIQNIQLRIVLVKRKLVPSQRHQLQYVVLSELSLSSIGYIIVS